MSIIGSPTISAQLSQFSTIKVYAPTGSTVTCTTPKGVILTATEISGCWIFPYLFLFGTYTIHASLGEKSLTRNIDVTTPKEYAFGFGFDTVYSFSDTDFTNAYTVVVHSGRCSFELLTGQYSSTRGFKIVGTDADSSAGAYFAKFPGYAFYLDTTYYRTLSFYFMKSANHGALYVSTGKDRPTPELSADSTISSLYIHYNNLSSSWTQYTLDISDLIGYHYLYFGGGWWDKTGNTTSDSRYSNLQLLG